MKSKILFLALVCAALSGRAFGDGKFFYLEGVPVGVPYQRAIILYEAGNETLILQSKYKTTAKDANSIAWVVPVTSVPEMASMDAGEAKFMFLRMGMHSSPKVIPVISLAIYLGVIALVCVAVATLLNWISARFMRACPKPLVSTMRITVWTLVLAFLIASLLMPSLGKDKAGVDVLKAETVGIYDVKVIKGNDANGVTGWLKDNRFGYGEGDSNVFDKYIKKNWCFVTAKVNRKADVNSREVISQGLAAPLILRFDANEAVYPMALTATVGSKTEILLYVLSDHKMDCGGRLNLAFAGETTWSFDRLEAPAVEPNEFFTAVKRDKWYMSKFKGKLMPEEMQEDIVFRQAKDDKPYREIKWR